MVGPIIKNNGKPPRTVRIVEDIDASPFEITKNMQTNVGSRIVLQAEFYMTTFFSVCVR